MCTYASTRVKKKSFCWKSELQMVLLISGGHICVPKLYTNMESSYKATKVSETFRQITQKLWAIKTWDLEKLFAYKSFITFRFLGSFYCTVSRFIFLRRVYCVTVKTIYWSFVKMRFLVNRCQYDNNKQKTSKSMKSELCTI